MAKSIGMGGSVTVGGTSYPVSTWSAAGANDVQDVTDTGSGGWRVRLAGVNDCEINFTAFFGAAATSFTATFSPGTTVAASLGVSGTSPAVTGNFIVSSATITNAATSPVEFQCTALSTGTVNFPT